MIFLQMGECPREDRGVVDVKATRFRQRLIHGSREPVSTANSSYPQFPQLVVNA
jgi:hypothetical protein